MCFEKNFQKKTIVRLKVVQIIVEKCKWTNNWYDHEIIFFLFFYQVRETEDMLLSITPAKSYS